MRKIRINNERREKKNKKNYFIFSIVVRTIPIGMILFFHAKFINI